MPESFIDSYKIITRRIKPLKPQIKESFYTPEESLFLMYSENFIRLSNEGICTNNRRKKQIEIISRQKELNRTINTYGLFTETCKSAFEIIPSKPNLFKGFIKINGRKITVSSNNFNIFVIQNKNRFNLHQNGFQMNIELSKLDGFSGRFKIEKQNMIMEIQYQRIEPFILKYFIKSVINIKIESILNVINLFNIDFKEMLEIKIESFMNGECSSFLIFEDLSFLSKLDIEMNLNNLVEYLSDSISRCKCDDFGYELYCYVDFILLINNNNFTVYKSSDSKFLSIQNGLHDKLYQKISNHILELKKLKSHRDSFSEMFSCLKFYIEQGIPLDLMLFRTIFDESFDSNLINFAKFYLLKDEKLNYLTNSLSLNNFSLNGIFKTFCNDLNKLLKNTSENYDEIEKLYDYFFKVFKNHKLTVFFDLLTEMHLKRIRKSKNLEDLKAIHRSIIKTEKLFEFRNEKVESKLKKRVLEFCK